MSAHNAMMFGAMTMIASDPYQTAADVAAVLIWLRPSLRPALVGLGARFYIWSLG